MFLDILELDYKKKKMGKLFRKCGLDFVKTWPMCTFFINIFLFKEKKV